MQKIKRDLAIIKYRKLPLFEFDKEFDKDVNYFPKFTSIYWVKLEKFSSRKLINSIT